MFEDPSSLRVQHRLPERVKPYPKGLEFLDPRNRSTESLLARPTIERPDEKMIPSALRLPRVCEETFVSRRSTLPVPETFSA